MTYVPEHVHLLGSIALPSGTEVSRACGRALGEPLQRIPDGEPGGRRMWISRQMPLLRACPFFRLAAAAQPGQRQSVSLRSRGRLPQTRAVDKRRTPLEQRP